MIEEITDLCLLISVESVESLRLIELDDEDAIFRNSEFKLQLFAWEVRQFTK